MKINYVYIINIFDEIYHNQRSDMIAWNRLDLENKNIGNIYLSETSIKLKLIAFKIVLAIHLNFTL